MRNLERQKTASSAPGRAEREHRGERVVRLGGKLDFCNAIINHNLRQSRMVTGSQTFASLGDFSNSREKPACVGRLLPEGEAKHAPPGSRAPLHPVGEQG